MAKFNVGDKVICIKDYTHFTQGEVYKIQNIDGKIITLLDNDIEHNDWCVEDFNKHFEIVPTKNQRITALENEVAELRPLKQEIAELKLIVHELRERPQLTTVINNTPQEPSTIVEDIIEFEGKKYCKVDHEAREGDVVIFTKIPREDRTTDAVLDNKPYEVRLNSGGRAVIKDDDDFELYVYGGGVLEGTLKTVDVYELIESKPLTPNQQRAVIIEKAKKFVEKYKNLGVGSDYHDVPFCKKVGHISAKFYVNEKKNVVVVVVQSLYSKEKKHGNKGIAKCNPSDVFNEWIGKAISLGRALGLDVSEFEQAVQPTEYVVGQIVRDTNDDYIKPFEIHSIGKATWGETKLIDKDETWLGVHSCEIINDTNAKYEVES